MQSVSLKSVLIPSLAGFLIGLYFLGQVLSDSETPRIQGGLAALGKNLEPHSHDNDEAKMVLEEALKFKSQPKKEITYRLFARGERSWMEKLYRQSFPNGERFFREESYILTPTGDKLVKTTIFNREGFWEIREGGLIRLNYRKGQKNSAEGLKRMVQMESTNLKSSRNELENGPDRNKFNYEMKRGIDFNGFDCVQIIKHPITESKEKIVIEMEKFENVMPVQTTVFYIDSNNYIVGEENYSEDGNLVSKSRIDDYELGDVFGDEVFKIDESYIRIEANSYQEYSEISKALALSLYFFNTERKI